MMRSKAAALLVPVAVMFFGCDSDQPAPVVPPESGFIEIKQVRYKLLVDGVMQTQITDKTRIWYAFQPALGDPSQKPLAVFFNGGPGSSTGTLLGYNTGRMSADRSKNGGVAVGPSPADWSTIANVIYIDARNTGYSYSLGSADSGFEVRNFNPYIDAADFIRVILRVLNAHPALKKIKVFPVGESYGGTRSTVMLNLLLNYKRYVTDDKIYLDPTLAAEIQAHLDNVFPERSGASFTAAEVANIFGRQVMISPAMLGQKQFDLTGEMLEAPGGPPHIVAAETGRTFTPCSQSQEIGCDPYYNAMLFIENAGRDAYHYGEPVGWMDRLVETEMPVLLGVANLDSLLLFNPVDMPMLYASARTGAYKIITPAAGARAATKKFAPLMFRSKKLLGAAADDEFVKVFGKLGDNDAYYVPSNDGVNFIYQNRAAPYSFYADRIGEMFLENVMDAATFITNCRYDTVIYEPAIPPTIRLFGQVKSVTESAETITIELNDNAFAGTTAANKVMKVAFPYYGDSGHPVTASQPEKFLKDVTEWMGK